MKRPVHTNSVGKMATGCRDVVEDGYLDVSNGSNIRYMTGMIDRMQTISHVERLEAKHSKGVKRIKKT